MITFTRRINSHDRPDYSTTLNFDQRTKSRIKVTLDNGEDAGIILDKGNPLADGDFLGAETGEVVRIIAADEPVSSVCTEDTHLFARACYHLGNRHTQVEIGKSCLCYLQDKVLDDMLGLLGLEISHERRPFNPEKGAYARHHG